jgi:hypothetical protein
MKERYCGDYFDGEYRIYFSQYINVVMDLWGKDCLGL